MTSEVSFHPSFTPELYSWEILQLWWVHKKGEKKRPWAISFFDSTKRRWNIDRLATACLLCGGNTERCRMPQGDPHPKRIPPFKYILRRSHQPKSIKYYNYVTESKQIGRQDGSLTTWRPNQFLLFGRKTKTTGVWCPVKYGCISTGFLFLR